MDGLSARGATFEAVLAAVFRRAPGEDISVSTASVVGHNLSASRTACALDRRVVTVASKQTVTPVGVVFTHWRLSDGAFKVRSALVTAQKFHFRPGTLLYALDIRLTPRNLVSIFTAFNAGVVSWARGTAQVGVVVAVHCRHCAAEVGSVAERTRSTAG